MNTCGLVLIFHSETIGPTKLLMTEVSRNSDEPANESSDPISAMNALELVVRTDARYAHDTKTVNLLTSSKLDSLMVSM